MKSYIYSLAATFITAAVTLGSFTACSEDLVTEKSKSIVEEAPACRITLPASFSNGAQTRAVTIGENTATTTFAETDKVYVVIEHDGVYAIAYDPAERKCISMTVTPGSNPATATLSGALKFYYDDGDRNPLPLTPAEGDAVYLFYNMRLPDLNPAYLYFNYLYQTGSKDQKVASYWDYYYGATYHDYGQAKMKIAALDGDDSEGYTMSLVQYDNPDESKVRFENVGSLFRQELIIKDKNGDTVTPTLTRFVVTTAEDKTIYMYCPLASTQENRYIRGPVAMEPLDLSGDGNIYFAMMFVDDIKNETLYITAEDEDGNVYTATKAAPAGGFENGKYYYGKLELTWQKCKAPTVTGTSTKPIYGNYELTENPVNITISGYSEEYEFRLENGQGGTFTLDNLTAYGYIFINQKHIYPDPQGDVSLVLKGDNSINANAYWGILLYGGLKMSCIGASATITITTTTDGICGLSCSNYRNDVDYDNPAYNRNTDESETDVTDLLAAPGFTVTRSAPTKAYDSTYGHDTYTYTYTVENKAAAYATAGDIGKVIGANGIIYDDATAATNAGTTAEAMIAFVGKIDGVCDHGLAISLTDVYQYNATFAEATGDVIISSWAASHSIAGGTWRLPSEADWQRMIWGYYADNPAATDISTFQTKLGAVGTALIDDAYYWTSTGVDTENAKTVLYDAPYAGIQSVAKTGYYHVRACLAF